MARHTGNSLKLEKYSIGVGDRFARQAKAQLRACIMAAEKGVEVIPVWNKSNREHMTIGSKPATTRAAADAAVKALGWSKPYHVDADHIRLETVEPFVAHSDFYTIDVADSIGKPASAEAVRHFARSHPELVGIVDIPGIEPPFKTTHEQLERIAAHYLRAVQDAARVYRHLAEVKGAGAFITEISMDETDHPQTPPELMVILAAIADMGIPVQTIAPKFTGRFNKGVDYVGNVAQFEREFNDDLAVIACAIKQYDLPENLKLSMHSGSDKFSIYEPMHRGLKRFNAGLHVKTAGTTWLEEIIGLSEANGAGLDLAKEIYSAALLKGKELCAPYVAVVDINWKKLPSAETVNSWTSEQFVAAVRHDPRNPSFNPHLRQLLHVGYKIAGGMGNRYLDALEASKAEVEKNVTENLYQRHLKPLFLNGA